MTNRARSGAVLVGYDGRRSTHAALAWATHEAESRGLPLHLVHALTGDDEPRPGSGAAHRAQEATDAALALVEQLAPGLEVHAETVVGPPARELLSRARTCAVVVLGGRRHDDDALTHGHAVAEQLAGRCGCPLVVVRDTAHLTATPSYAGRAGHRQRVMVGVDGSGSCGAAVEFAFDRASRLGLGLTVLTCRWRQETWPHGADAVDWAAPPQEEQARLVGEELAGRRDAHPDVDVETRLVGGHPVDALIEESAASEMLVLGSRGCGGFEGLTLGSVSRRVLTHARTPVAVVPSEPQSSQQSSH
ncbi:universal stress protein [Intrasporangium flavum]|uniref:universal stress protein n=1 Tax=Intrasporangium flavum TaxID=1428657 RepID=UPI00096D32E0|nr:universal stress protein [Intrasporangium flavum]